MGRDDDLNRSPPGISRDSMRRGLIGFLLLTVAGLGALYFVTLRGDVASGELRAVLTNLHVGFLLLAVGATLADWLISAVRYQIFLTRIEPGTRLSVPFKADLVGRFTGAITPSQTGGGPGQIFMLYKGGISVPDVLSVLMVNFVATLVFFFVVGGSAAWYLQDQFSNVAIQSLIQWAFVAFVGGMVFIAVSLTRPDLLARPINALTRRLEGNPREWARVIRRSGEVLVESAERYRESCVRCLREWPLLPVASLVLTVILYLNKFTLAWFLMRGLGVDGSYVTTLAVQALLTFILYVAPTPGGSGIGELSTAALMHILLPTHLLVPFTLASRFFLLYLPAAVGALILAYTLRPGSQADRDSTPPDPALAAGGTAQVQKGVKKAAVARSAAVTSLALAFALTLPGPPDLGAQTTGLRRPVVVPTLSAGHGPTEDPAVTYRRRADLVRHAVEAGILAPSREDSLAAFREAVDTAQALVLAAQDDADAHYLYSVALGNILELAGTREKMRLAGETRWEAETALGLDPNHAGAHHVLGRLHAAAMRLSSFVRFIAGRILGAEALDGASWEQAEYHFSRARELEPWNPRHSLELGVLYLDTDRPALGLEALRQAAGVPSIAQASDSLLVARATRLVAELQEGS
jgi:uncharacterized protein (TIRG00374 family)